VPPLVNPVQVSAGGIYTCAVDDTGVVCWGNNFDGQMDVPALSNPVQVSAKKLHTCAVDDTGVVCWGNNDMGQTDVPALVNPVHVSAGLYHTCALDDTGVVCWGWTTVPALVNPVQVNAGIWHTCVLDDTGVLCWGHDEFGQSTVPALTIDPDGDGLCNAEDAFPLNAFMNNNATLAGSSHTPTEQTLADSDGDGFANATELVFGSDPNDPMSMPLNAPVPSLTHFGLGLLGSLIGVLGATHLARRSIRPNGVGAQRSGCSARSLRTS